MTFEVLVGSTITPSRHGQALVRELPRDVPRRRPRSDHPKLRQQRARCEQQHGVDERVERVGDHTGRRRDVIGEAADRDGGVAGFLPDPEQTTEHATAEAAVVEQLRQHVEDRYYHGGVQEDGRGRGVEKLDREDGRGRGIINIIILLYKFDQI